MYKKIGKCLRFISNFYSNYRKTIKLKIIGSKIRSQMKKTFPAYTIMENGNMKKVYKLIEEKNSLIKLCFMKKEILFFDVIFHKAVSVNDTLIPILKALMYILTDDESKKRILTDHINGIDSIDKAESLYNNLYLFDINKYNINEKNIYLTLINNIFEKEFLVDYPFRKKYLKIDRIPNLWNYSLSFRYFLSDFIVRNLNHDQGEDFIFSNLNGVIMNGKYFKYFFPEQMYKCINRNMINREFEFCIGLNIDVNKFDPTKKHSKGGIHISNKENIDNYLFCGDFTWKVYVPDDAQVVISDNEVKTSKLIILDKEILFYFE